MAGYYIYQDFILWRLSILSSSSELETNLPNLWLCRGCALGSNWWTASALDVAHPEGKVKDKGDRQWSQWRA